MKKKKPYTAEPITNQENKTLIQAITYKLSCSHIPCALIRLRLLDWCYNTSERKTVSAFSEIRVQTDNIWPGHQNSNKIFMSLIRWFGNGNQSKHIVLPPQTFYTSFSLANSLCVCLCVLFVYSHLYYCWQWKWACIFWFHV